MSVDLGDQFAWGGGRWGAVDWGAQLTLGNIWSWSRNFLVPKIVSEAVTEKIFYQKSPGTCLGQIFGSRHTLCTISREHIFTR